jgi:hypothetical protein
MITQIRSLAKAAKAINAASVADPIVQGTVNAAVLQARNAGAPRVVVERALSQAKIAAEQSKIACDAAYGV